MTEAKVAEPTEEKAVAPTEVDVQAHKNNTVSKSNVIIEATGTLSGTTQKMLASIISMLRSDDTEFTRYALKIDDYLKLIGSTTKNVDFVKEQAKKLMTNPFEIDGDIFNWCSRVRTKEMEGYLVFDIHPDLKPHLLDFQKKGNFTQYKIINILSLKGEYSPRIYEFFTMKYNKYMKHNPSAKSYSFDVKIDTLREFLKIPKSYKNNDIKRFIIEKTQKDFKKYTDLKFEYKEQKIGRRVDRFVITLKSNDQGSNNFLRTRKSFIDHMRKNYVNRELIHTRDKKNGEELILSVSRDGLIYSQLGQEFEPDRALEIWDGMYVLAKEGKLPILGTIQTTITDFIEEDEVKNKEDEVQENEKDEDLNIFDVVYGS